MTQLDVREVPPRNRHPMIFEKFDNLQPGESFELINDHAPAPLYYQFLHERPEQFEWSYLEEGPTTWRVAITRKNTGKSMRTAQDYILIEDMESLIETIQPESIVSRTFHKDERVKGILFGFDAGQELSEHTASQAAIIQIVRGEATVTLGEDQHELSAGSWIYMPPRLKHSIYAKTPLHMLLLMFGNE